MIGFTFESMWRLIEEVNQLKYQLKENHDRAEEIIKARENLICHLHNQLRDIEAANNNLEKICDKRQVEIAKLKAENTLLKIELSHLITKDSKLRFD